MARNQILPTEHQEQVALILEVDRLIEFFPCLEWLYAIPNAGKRSLITGKRLKNEGMRAGVPDLCIPVSRGHFASLYIEMKRQKGGRLSPDQVRWRDGLQDQGHKVVVCNGWREALKELLLYIEPEGISHEKNP